MPGRGSYGPAGAWVYRRAHRIMEDGKTPENVAFATAVQQAHKVGKSPKRFRTAEGVRTAKEKYQAPKELYRKTAAFFDELEKIGMPESSLLRKSSSGLTPGLGAAGSAGNPAPGGLVGAGAMGGLGAGAAAGVAQGISSSRGKPSISKASGAGIPSAGTASSLGIPGSSPF